MEPVLMYVAIRECIERNWETRRAKLKSELWFLRNRGNHERRRARPFERSQCRKEVKDA